MADTEAVLFDSFSDHLRHLLRGREVLLENLDDQRARELGRRGADAALAPLLWGEAVGDRWDTTETAEFLGVTRQALYERVKRATLLGLPGRGVTWFPTWQFDLPGRRSRPVVTAVLEVFGQMEHPLDALEVASWATKVRSDLDGITPAEWISDGRPDEQAVAAARHSAARLAG